MQNHRNIDSQLAVLKAKADIKFCTSKQTNTRAACWTINRPIYLKNMSICLDQEALVWHIDGRFSHCISRHCSAPQSLSQYHSLLPVMFRLGLHIIWTSEKGAWRRLLCPVCVSCEYVLGGGWEVLFFVPRGFLIILGLTGHRPLNLHGGHSDWQARVFLLSLPLQRGGRKNRILS